VKHWNTFEDDKQIEDFLQMKGDFQNMQIDEENVLDENENAWPISYSNDFLNTIGGKDIL